MHAKARLDFTQFDAESANLDLMINSAQVLDIAIGEIANEVAGPIETTAGLTKRILDKTFSGQVRLVEITTRQTRAANKEFTRHPHRQGLEPLIEDEELFIREWPPNVISAAARAQSKGGINRGFGRAVEI